MKINDYKPKIYWEKRLEDQPNLKGVGYFRFNETYNKYLYSLKVLALDKILDMNSIITKNKSVLDVGCGTGFFVDYYNKKNTKKITGIDITKISISMLKEKYPTHNFKVANISDSNLNFNETFDVINAFDVLYHITDDEGFESAIRNISNLCAMKGHILITDVFWKNHIVPTKHVRFRNLQKYKEILLKNDIKILSIFPMYYLLNRNFYLPTFVLNKLSPIFYFVDKNLQRMKIPNCKNIKLLIGRKK